jgi:hypothetical protein
MNNILQKLNQINGYSFIKDFPLFHAITNTEIYKNFNIIKRKNIDFSKLYKCSGLKVKTSFTREDIYDDTF